MSQHDMIIDNAAGSSVRADINSALQALASNSKGNSAPSTPYTGQIWIDGDTPSGTVWAVSMYDGSDWVKMGELDTASNIYTPFIGSSSIFSSPTFTGTPAAPTASAGTNTTQLATTAFVTAALAASLGFKVGLFSRDTSLAAGNQSITGVGFQPRSVIFLQAIGNTKQMSVGVDDGTTSGALYQTSTAGTFGVLV